MTARTTSFPATPRTRGKHVFYCFLAFFAMLMTVPFFTGCGSEQSEYEQGTASLEKGDYTAAFKHFTRGADSDAKAKLMLSLCYRTGIGVVEDTGKADQLLEEAAVAGDEYALFCYAYDFLTQDEEEKGMRYLKRSVDKGCVLAQMIFAVLSLADDRSGDALKYYEIVADQPLTDRKTPFDYIPELTEEFSEELYESLSFGDMTLDLKLENPSITNMSIVVSQISLGMLYAAGEDTFGIKRDEAKAKEWIKRAEKNGFAKADEFLKKLGVD